MLFQTTVQRFRPSKGAAKLRSGGLAQDNASLYVQIKHSWPLSEAHAASGVQSKLIRELYACAHGF